MEFAVSKVLRMASALLEATENALSVHFYQSLILGKKEKTPYLWLASLLRGNPCSWLPALRNNSKVNKDNFLCPR